MEEMKIDWMGLMVKLDPFHRDPNGYALGFKSKGMSYKLASVLEFSLSVIHREATPSIESLAIIRGGHVIANGDYFGTAHDLQRNLSNWIQVVALSNIEIRTFQKILNDVIGYSTQAQRIQL